MLLGGLENLLISRNSFITFIKTGTNQNINKNIQHLVSSLLKEYKTTFIKEILTESRKIKELIDLLNRFTISESEIETKLPITILQFVVQCRPVEHRKLIF